MATIQEMGSQVSSAVSGLNMLNKILLIAGLVAIVVGLVSFTAGTKLEYKVLYSGLNEQDAADVVAALEDGRMNYKLSDGGQAILVPGDKVYDYRLKMAGKGLPRGGGVGFEIFDKTSLGTTDFVQKLNYQRALQGELARTIRSFDQVQEARVHIASPKKSVFIENERPPSASISVRLRGREKLAQHEIRAVVNLVAGAVAGLTTENITMVDTTGRLLYRKTGDDESMISATQLEYQLKTENKMERKIESMLEEVVGVGRVMAKVSTEIDFTRIQYTEENFDPEGQVVRSEQRSVEQEPRDGEQPSGIPGVKGALATFSESGGGAATSSTFRRDNLTRNYEISKITRQVQQPTGSIKRLSVAVMVDGTYDREVGEEGATTQTYKERTPEEMQFFTKLVKNAIGYNEERLDQVEVVNMAFAVAPEIIEEPKVTDRLLGLAERHFSITSLIYLVILVGFLFVILPRILNLLMSGPMPVRMATGRPGARISAVVGGAPMTPEEEMSLAPKEMSDKERIYKLAQSDPNRAADLVKRWLREE